MLASPSPTLSTPNTAIPPTPSFPPVMPAGFTMLDLEILHWWTTRCVESFIDFEACISLFRIQIVELGFVHPFLMHEILSVSALHLSKIVPHKAAIYKHACDSHLATALALFQPEIANISVSNCDACFAFSTLVFTHAFASQETTKPSTLFFMPTRPIEEVDMVNVPVQWVKLHRGSLSVLQKIFPSLKDGLFEPLFAPWKAMDPHREAPLPTVEDTHLSALSQAWASTPTLSDQQKDDLEATLISTRRIFSILAYNPEISKMSAVMSWFSVIKDEFIKMLEEKIPEALLIALYYCVALKRAEHMWWVYEKGENLLRTILEELGPEWERWTQWPTQAVLGDQRLPMMEAPRQVFSVSNMLV